MALLLTHSMIAPVVTEAYMVASLPAWLLPAQLWCYNHLHSRHRVASALHTGADHQHSMPPWHVHAYGDKMPTRCT
jgi:hypothetical protein